MVVPVNSKFYNCVSCTTGKFASKGAKACTPCAVGRFAQAGAKACDPCAPGRYVIYVGASDCTLCPAGTFNNVKGAALKFFCQQCPSG